MIRQSIDKASSLRRDDLLKYKAKSDGTRIPFAAQFHPQIPALSNNLKKEFTSLRDDTHLKDLFSEPPILTFRQPPNLRSLLTSSKLPSSQTDDGSKGNKGCLKPRCHICKHITTGSQVLISGVNFTLQPPPLLTCDSKNLVYIFHCNICPQGIYVGETGTPFRLRFNNHKKSIRDNKAGFPVAQHFNLPNHSIDNLQCTLIASNFKCPRLRKQSEIYWILKLKSNVNGLNRDLGPLSNFKSIVNA